MSPSHDRHNDALTEDQMVLVNRLCNQFEARWQRGEKTAVESILVNVNPGNRLAALTELIPLEIEYRSLTGQPLSLDEYKTRFPDLDPIWLQELLNGTQVWDSATQVHDTTDISAVPQKLGDYRIVSRIGSGGMGTVYKAVHERMGRMVALKVLRTEIQRDPQLLKRFDREVRVAARLTHPNIVAALDAREQDGLHYLITEYVDGVDLQAEVIGNGPLTISAAIDCLLQAARGLDYAHQQGVIHRDIKPANLLRDAHGVVKVLDMGLARLDASGEPAESELTQSGMVMGTAAYMSPEQARDTRRADARSDIYSLGCTLFYLLNGRSIFVGESIIDTLISHVSQPIPLLTRANARVPPALEHVFHRMVAKSPADRFQSAAELVAALEEIQSQRPELTDDVASAPSATQVSFNSESIRTDKAGMDEDSQYQLEPTEFVKRGKQSSQSGISRRQWIVGGAVAVTLAGLVYAFLPSGDRGIPTPPRSAGLNFDGRSSYVAVPDLLPTSDENYTLEALVQPLEFRTSNMISWLGPNWMALFLLKDGRFGVCRRVDGKSYLIQSNEPATLGQTYHIAGVYRGQELQLYVNGQHIVPTKFDFDLGETNGGLFIGGVPVTLLPRNQNERFFQGTIRAVRISRGIRYKSDFTRPETLEADPETIACFPFEEGHGTETVGQGIQRWVGEIVNARWQPVNDTSR